MKKTVLISSLLIMFIGTAVAQTQQETEKWLEDRLKQCFQSDTRTRLESLSVRDCKITIQTITTFQNGNSQTTSVGPINGLYFEGSSGTFLLYNRERVVLIKEESRGRTRTETMNRFDERFNIPSDLLPRFQNALKHLQSFCKEPF